VKNPFPWLTIGICSALLLPPLFMNGMFSDGMLYASVSKNYAQGLGTFWEQFYSTTAYTAFHEQPPLLFFLQGMFFKILGTSMYTERIYCLLAALINAFLIYRCWKISYPARGTWWMPLLFWFTMPVTFYAFINNLEESTMSVFVLAAMVHVLRALHLKQRETLHLLLAGAMILLAGLTKGVQGMFLLSAPFFWWLCFRKTGFFIMLRQSFLLALIPVLFAIYAWFTPAIHASLEVYFTSRFFSTFHHLNDTSTSRFHILYELFLDLLSLFVMLTLILVASTGKKGFFSGWKEQKKLILFFALTAASGILPLMVTMEQRGFYLVTALPFIALAASLFIAPNIEQIQQKMAEKGRIATFLSIFGVFITISAIISTFFFAGKPKRDSEKLHDLPLIAAKTGEWKTLLTTKNIFLDWGFSAYAMRNHSLSVTENKTVANEWLVLEKTDPVPEGYQLISLPTERYLLFRKKP
jgi:4-amino-4-deoxy-L-arabinose transferase-like glycosyltransferase